MRWLLLFLLACSTRSDALRFFASRTESGVLVTTPSTRRVTIYANALVSLVLMRHGKREEARTVLLSMAAVQAEDGSLPFSYRLPRPPTKGERWVRSGAMAWVGYAAVQWLREGTDERILQLARGVARYFLAHQKDDLILGGEVTWTSTEHNIDAYFFFAALEELSGEHRGTADRIARALMVRTWSDEAGQFYMGGSDRGLALDCASWGALFLLSIGEREKAEKALRTADTLYVAAGGHKPYPHLDGVWPEGSAGVALAALRLGQRERAEKILADLEKLRRPSGALPDFTREVPGEFDTEDSIASTAWVELVRLELARPSDFLDRRRPTAR